MNQTVIISVVPAHQTVYQTQDKRIELTMEEYRGKKIVKLNIINRYQGEDFKEAFDSEGGSAKIVLGIVVSIFFILKTNSPRIIIFDETLSAFSTPVLHRFLSVLRKFTEDLGFVFVLIEHSAYRIKNYINKIYTIENGVYREVGTREWDNIFKRSKGEVDE